MADTADISLPFLVCDAGVSSPGTASITLPTLEVVGGDTNDGSAEVTLPSLQLEAYAIDGPGGSADIALPMLELFAESSFNADIALPMFELSASGYEVAYSTADIALPRLGVEASGYTERDGTADISLPRLQLTASVASGMLAEADINLPALRVEAAGFHGESGTADITLPAIEVTAVSGEPVVGTADIALPMFWLEAHSYNAPADVWRTWVMHLGSAAVTEYTGFEFTSFMTLNGVVYATGPDGIYALDDSDSDAGTAISGSFLTGNYNFGDSHTKRVPRMYLEVKTRGDLRVSTTVAVGGRRVYGMYYDGVDSLRTRRVPIGRGPRSVHWQFGASNVEGANFEISRILVHPEITRRRVF